MGSGDLTNGQWARLKPLLPTGIKPGRPQVWARRQPIDGIRWRTRTGAPGRDVPERYGPWERFYDLFRRWQRDDTWARTLTQLQAEADAKGLSTWADHGLGRLRGGLTSEIHLAVEQGQKPLSVVIMAGQRGDSPQFETVLEAIRVSRPGPGRPHKRPDRVRADKAYDSRKDRSYLHRRGVKATVPAPADRVRNRLKRPRAVATRYDKLAVCPGRGPARSRHPGCGEGSCSRFLAAQASNCTQVSPPRIQRTPSRPWTQRLVTGSGSSSCS
ncbi:IS5 family transposase [Streptomyces mutabilis]|uniref:IS5 family transposase n=1 Tax=Streptomyces mutabilis TaxID=67332 RepID=UPI003F4BD5CF